MSSLAQTMRFPQMKGNCRMRVGGKAKVLINELPKVLISQGTATWPSSIGWLDDRRIFLAPGHSSTVSSVCVRGLSWG